MERQINNNFYDSYGERWYTAFDDPVALLRAESKTKTPWVIEKIRDHYRGNTNVNVLDVGCGAGFLSNALAREGFHVTGVDMSIESLRVAGLYDTTESVKYISGDVYRLPFTTGEFDVVTAMDFLEHVHDPKQAIAEMSRVIKPGGLFIFHTFNRNLISGFVIIKLVEWFIRNTPKNMHILSLFVKPKELTEYAAQANLEVKTMTGIKPVITSIPLKNIFSGIVPDGLRFEFTSSLLLSYMGLAIKK